MFGEATQQPNTYLAATFGSRQSAWRGLATVVFKGGKYGAMNPYPQKASYKIRKIKKGWDDDVCWYPEKAAISLLAGGVSMLGEGWEYKVETFSEPNTIWNDFAVPTSGWSLGASCRSRPVACWAVCTGRRRGRTSGCVGGFRSTRSG
ncbi:hypothetical protein [Lysobacter enzymogenes]|uniref:hypothetical protein n=1 Tax=Lysobacter enzymogenes TaxID=69 RepID=UPI002264D0FF|nr:hypothetical protein [Lysobacter enzymogenes]UZW62769.1 hypothetical protein BV903_010945 [Lysobacter enzymogenes]